MTQQSVIEEITTAIRPIVEASGNYLEEVTVTPVGKSRMVTVIVDNEKHLNLDQVTAVSREISEVIETLRALGETPFTLEVTSPGVDRPLTAPRHWRKNVDRLVKATMNDGTVVEGRIGQVSEFDVVVGAKTLNYSDIKKALIEIEFKSTVKSVDVDEDAE
jgi:ribosome maturation factor RimP